MSVSQSVTLKGLFLSYLRPVSVVIDSCFLRLRRRNDQQMLMERIFLLPQGLPGQHSNRHALFSPAKFNSYGKFRVVIVLDGTFKNYSGICLPWPGRSSPRVWWVGSGKKREANERIEARLQPRLKSIFILNSQRSLQDLFFVETFIKETSLRPDDRAQTSLQLASRRNTNLELKTEDNFVIKDLYF